MTLIVWHTNSRDVNRGFLPPYMSDTETCPFTMLCSNLRARSAISLRDAAFIAMTTTTFVTRAWSSRVHHASRRQTVSEIMARPGSVPNRWARTNPGAIDAHRRRGAVQAIETIMCLSITAAVATGPFLRWESHDEKRVESAD